MTDNRLSRFEAAIDDATLAIEAMVETYRTGWLNECYNDAVRAVRVAMSLAETETEVGRVIKERSKLLNLQLAFGLPSVLRSVTLE